MARSLAAGSGLGHYVGCASNERSSTKIFKFNSDIRLIRYIVQHRVLQSNLEPCNVRPFWNRVLEASFGTELTKSQLATTSPLQY